MLDLTDVNFYFNNPYGNIPKSVWGYCRYCNDNKIIIHAFDFGVVTFQYPEDFISREIWAEDEEQQNIIFEHINIENRIDMLERKLYEDPESINSFSEELNRLRMRKHELEDSFLVGKLSEGLKLMLEGEKEEKEKLRELFKQYRKTKEKYSNICEFSSFEKYSFFDKRRNAIYRWQQELRKTCQDIEDDIRRYSLRLENTQNCLKNKYHQDRAVQETQEKIKQTYLRYESDSTDDKQDVDYNELRKELEDRMNCGK